MEYLNIMKLKDSTENLLTVKMFTLDLNKLSNDRLSPMNL